MHTVGLVLLSVGLLRLVDSAPSANSHDFLPWPFYLGLCCIGVGLMLFHHSRVNSK
jgi:hypothetical protein